MNFMSRQAISRPTRSTSRLLISLSFTVWLIKFYDVDIVDLKFSEITLPPNLYSTFYIGALSFLLINHLLNWYGNYISYKGWNIGDKETSVAGFGSDSSLTSRLISTLAFVRNECKNEKMKERILERLDEIKHDISSVLIPKFVPL